MVWRGLHRFIRQTRSESGQSLVLAFIVMCALSITVGGVISFTTSNESQFGRDRQLDRAFHIAEAGLNNGMEVVEKSDPSNAAGQIGTRIPATGTYTLSLDGGAGTFYAQKYAATSPECTTHAGSAPNSCWVVIATGNSPNGKIIKQLQESIYWRTVTEPIDDVYGYGLFVANPPGSADCVDTHGTTTLDIDNVWINGDFCPAGGVGFEPTADSVGSVYIGGTYEGRNNTSIGTSSRYYKTVNIASGCTVQGKVNNCDTSANIYSRDVAPGAAGSALQKPDIESAAATLYASANWTSPTCLPAGTASPFDDPAHPGPNQSNPQTLFTGASFDCKVVDSGGVTHRMQWNSVTQTLSVQNGVYIDGDVGFPNGAGTFSIGSFTNDAIGPAIQSNGTIYVNGVMNGSANQNVCGPGTVTATPNYGCLLRWDASLGEIGFAVINPLNAATGFSMTGNGELDIMIIVNQGYADTGGTIIAGPVLADRATIGGNGGFVVPNNPPSGTPTDITTQASWVVQPGAWKEQK
jgi:Tfp pilus assembly protein PilX